MGILDRPSVAPSDARLTDARPPTAHAGTHAHGSGDELAGYARIADGSPEPIIAVPNVSGDWTPNLASGSTFQITCSGDTRIMMPTVADGNGYGFLVSVLTNGHTVTYDPKVQEWAGDVQPTLSATKRDLLGFTCEGDHLFWRGMHYTAKPNLGQNYLDLPAISEPPNPPSGTLRMWYDSTQLVILSKDSAGNKKQGFTTASTGTGVISQVAGQVASGKGAAGTTYSRSLPAPATAGHLIVAVFMSDSTGTHTNTVGGLAAATGSPYAGTHGVGKVGIYWKVAAGGEQTFTFTTSTTGTPCMWVAEFQGNAASPFDQHAENELASPAQTVSATTGATVQAAELAIMAVLTGGTYAANGLGTGSSGFAIVVDFQGSGVATKGLSAIGAVTATATWPGNLPASIIAATFKAA